MCVCALACVAPLLHAPHALQHDAFFLFAHGPCEQTAYMSGAGEADKKAFEASRALELFKCCVGSDVQRSGI